MISSNMPGIRPKKYLAYLTFFKGKKEIEAKEDNLLTLNSM